MTARAVLAAMARLRERHRTHPRLAAIARELDLEPTTIAAVLDRLIERGRIRRGYYDDRAYIDTAEQHWRRTT